MRRDGRQQSLFFAQVEAVESVLLGMLTAWSILNKVVNRTDARFSDMVLIVCPNVTIRDRLRELDVDGGEGSLYRTRDLVPRINTTNSDQFAGLRNYVFFGPPLAGAIRSARSTKWVSVLRECATVRVPRAAHEMIVHHSRGLHVRVTNRRADECEAPLDEIFAERI